MLEATAAEDPHRGIPSPNQLTLIRHRRSRDQVTGHHSERGVGLPHLSLRTQKTKAGKEVSFITGPISVRLLASPLPPLIHAPLVSNRTSSISCHIVMHLHHESSLFLRALSIATASLCRIPPLYPSPSVSLSIPFLFSISLTPHGLLVFAALAFLGQSEQVYYIAIVA